MAFARSAASAPPDSLVMAQEALKSKIAQVKEALEIFSRQKRRPLLGLGKSRKKSDVKKFWSLVSRKTKKESGISSLQRKRDGVLVHKPEDLAEEATNYLMDIFDGVEGVHAQKERQFGGANKVEHRFLPPELIQPRLEKKESSDAAVSNPQQFMDRDFSESEVVAVLKGMGAGKAAGWDQIPNEALLESPKRFQHLLVVLFNRVKNGGAIPESWRRGRLVLIHKKGATTDIFNYRPLTILTSMSSLFTKVLNKRLTKVVEGHGLLGQIQNGFRKGRSGNDAAFILNTVLSKVAAKNKKVHLGFLDLVKAYDSVDRGVLWSKMKGLGFGGKFLAIIQDFYMGDHVVSQVGGASTKPVYLGRGVRQGCSMSPLLFALYLSSLGHELTRSTLGVKLHSVVISALFFADDVVLIARTAEGLKELLSVVQAHCRSLRMRLSAPKSKIISPAEGEWELASEEEPASCLGKVLSFRYLGVEIFLSPFKGSIAMQQRAVRVFNQYRGACINLARDGPDVVDVAMALWSNIAVSSALHGCEVVSFSPTSIDTMERQQTAVGKFALGLPTSAPNAAVQALLGLRPVRQVIYSRQLKFLVRLREQDQSRWSHDAFLDHLHGGWVSPFLSNIANIKREIGMTSAPLSPKHVDDFLDTFFLHKLNQSLHDLNLRGLKGVPKLGRLRHVQECAASQVGGGGYLE